MRDVAQTAGRAPSAANLVVVTDFDPASDAMVPRQTMFPAIGPALDGNEFVIAAAAQDASDRLIYNDATGALLYDPDGTDAAPAVHFATLSPGLPLALDHFTVTLL